MRRNPLVTYLVGCGCALLLVAAVLSTCPACTYNQVTFEKDSVRFADDVTVEPGQASDTTDSGATGAPTTGGAGKLSPGGSNLIDGMLNVTLLIQQGGETPTTPTTTIDAQLTK